MDDSVYKVVELVGKSSLSWEDAVKNVVKRAKDSLHDLRVAEVSELDVKIEAGEVVAYRAKVKLSFKYKT
ncbi:MAG TPA: dodecin domain-containing protein [Desulfobulbaceae bacterium]|nr:dodecin domain-containing protein [Desulfobulbaceae bacterium]